MPRARALAAGTAVVLLSFSLAVVGSAGEQDLLLRIKNDVLDQKWDAALASCDEFVSKYPSSADLARATYFRAKALENLGSREEEAIAGYGSYLSRFPQEGGPLRVVTTPDLLRVPGVIAVGARSSG